VNGVNAGPGQADGRNPMTPHYSDDTAVLYHGDALHVLRSDTHGYPHVLGYHLPLIPDASVDAVVTDPPYGLEFMGKSWDGVEGFGQSLGETLALPGEQLSRMHAFQQWCQAWAVECLRVLKPGGYLLAFGGTRTAHRLTSGIEDAGFEIRDGIDWLYGSGFPKSLNVGGGRGTALKPAREPVVVARKPFHTTVAANVAAFGTGALNIDACRVGDEVRVNQAGGASSLQRVSRVEQGYRANVTASVGEASTVTGRWPANVVLSHDPDCGSGCEPGCPVVELDRQSGFGVSRQGAPRQGRNGDGWRMTATGAEYDDAGGASRFFPVFRYQAKAPASERPKVNGVAHPTVKPLDLMRWLVRLVCPPGGTVLDLFAGSGPVAEACAIEGFRSISIEREADYLPLVVSRLSKPLQQALWMPADGSGDKTLGVAA